MPSVRDGSLGGGVRMAVLQDIATRIIAVNRLRAIEARIGKLPERCRVEWIEREVAASSVEVQPKPSQKEDR